MNLGNFLVSRNPFWVRRWWVDAGNLLPIFLGELGAWEHVFA